MEKEGVQKIIVKNRYFSNSKLKFDLKEKK